MSKEPKSLKRKRKEHERAMHNARYALDREFTIMNQSRQFVATEQNGDMGVALPAGRSGLAGFMNEAEPGDVFVDGAVQGDLTKQDYERPAQWKAIADYLNDIGAYPVSVESSGGVEIDPSKPVEISFDIGLERRDYQLPAIAAVKAMEGDHIPRIDWGEPDFVIDSLPPGFVEDIAGEATVLKEPKALDSCLKSILLGKSEEERTQPTIDLTYGGIPGRVIPDTNLPDDEHQ